MSTWKKASCETCRFRVEAECRRHPPVIFSREFASRYPMVRHYAKGEVFQKACAEFVALGMKRKTGASQ